MAVVSEFISKYGEDIANRYLCYEIVDSYKAAIIYQKWCDRLGYKPLSQKEMDTIEKQYQKVKSQFGLDFTRITDGHHQ